MAGTRAVAHHVAGGACARDGALLGDVDGHPEVRQQDAARGVHQNVLGLDVAVADALEQERSSRKNRLRMLVIPGDTSSE